MARLGLTGVFVANASCEWDGQGIAALVLFSVASITDWLDGYLARRWNLITDFGRLMDPLADKVLVAAALFYMVYHEQAALWMAVLMVAREFLITGLRGVAAAKGRVLAAEKMGKHKTISQIVAIIAALINLAWGDIETLLEVESLGGFLREWLVEGVYWFFLWATLITVLSGCGYYLKNKELLSADEPPASPMPPKDTSAEGKSPI
jgi:CDP-diacylglycerol--glycerol-3-phosphate 3-phosphatidyltransferase